jgi:type IX secretion system substrate protein
MKKFFTNYFVQLLCLVLLCNTECYSQQSILVNLGSADCATPTSPVFSLIRNPLGPPAPSLLANCDLSAQLPDFFFVFIAYNPKDNKIYINDTRNGYSKVWVLDVGLPDTIQCPDSIPVAPTYTYAYLPNNFEFDNNGNLWSFHSYSTVTGLCTMDNFDVTNGNVLSTKSLQFPVANEPSDLNNGDVTILPNGRMFVVFGINPSRLYEITNYNGGPGNAIATYLQSMPHDAFGNYYNTFGLAYLNGELEITGTNAVNFCYFFPYDIASNTLGGGFYFQNNQAPIDNTSIDPIIGVTKQLTNVTVIDPTTADVTYNVYVRNMGNAILNNVNVSDNLATAFGAANVSNVTTNFLPGDNNAGLVLNPTYNGTTDTMLLQNIQELPNRISIDSNYFFELQINCRVSNIVLDSTYLNSAIGYGSIDTSASIINVTDSSNNGTSAVIDPNNNNNPGNSGENTPTPLIFFYPLPVHFIDVTAAFTNANTSLVQWTIATPTINANNFQLEYSQDAKHWYTISQIPITNPNQSAYQCDQQHVPQGDIYYRIKEVDDNGFSYYSRVVLLQNSTTNDGIVIYPNPANDAVEISMPYESFYGNNFYVLTDALGRVLDKKNISNATTQVDTQSLTPGTYWIRIESDNNISMHKIIVTH